MVDVDEEYEYYSSSSEPEVPAKKTKTNDEGASSSKNGVLDAGGLKRRAQELERIVTKLNKENKALKKNLFALHEKKNSQGP